MSKLTLSNEYLSAFSLQLSLLIHAGISIADGLHLLKEDEKNNRIKEMLSQMAEEVDDGCQLSEAMRRSNAFPEYVINMAATGEQTGRTEDAFRALTQHYESQRQLRERVRNAIAYPIMLLILMLIIIAVLLVEVLPIFSSVYKQLGGRMTGMAAGLLKTGYGIQKALPVILICVAIVIGIGLCIWFSKGLRAALVKAYHKFFGEYGIVKKISMARFASALAMGMMSGLPMEEALRTAMSFNEESSKTHKRYEECLKRLEDGSPLADALKESKVFAPMYCRMIALGVKSGAGDSIMEEIAKRLEDDATRAIDEKVARIEPTIVIVTSIIVGVILLSVMIPLMNIMSTIG